MSTKPGFLELTAAKWAAKLITFAATRAADRGDWHEVNHSLAALTAGNTGPHGCPAHCVFHDLTGSQVRTLVQTLKRGNFNTKAGDPISGR